MNKPRNLLTPDQVVAALKTLKLTAMAQKYEEMQGNPQYQHLSVDDTLGILVDYESKSRVIKAK